MSPSAGWTTPATRPALFRLVAANTSQTRSTWRCARNNQANGENTGPISRRIDQYHRHPLANTRSKAGARDWLSTIHRQSTGGWALWRSRSNFSDLSAGREQTSSDILGNRYFKPDGAWPGSLPSFLKFDNSVNRQSPDLSSKAHLQDFNFARSSRYSHFQGLQYDPISGRMVPESPRPETEHHNSKQRHSPVIGCPPGSEVEAKLASMTTLVEDGISQFRPPTAARQLNPRFISKSQSNDCSPGSDLEALFVANPTSQDAHVKASVSPEFTHNLNINISCPPGNELEAHLVSQSISSNEPHAEVYKAQRGTKSRGTNAGLSSRENIVYSPGNELKAFDGHSASRQTGIARKKRKSQQAKTTDVVDCAPGSELEAMFIAGPATAVDTHPKPEAIVESTNARKADITIDCPPGNELEAKMISDAASDGNAEDLSTLRASDIRARYTPQPRPAPDSNFHGSEDRVGDFILQKEGVSTENGSPTYHILAYDSSESRVTSAEAQSFFGDNDTAQPHEILARLHNPAKFVPYFAQLQQDGFTIATGGGDILVFKKASNRPKQAVSPSAADQDTQSHTRTPQYLRHDPYPSNNSGSSSKPSFGSGPSATETGASFTGAKSLSRRMFTLGTVTAALCYAIGEVTEYFHTGGKDGRGIDGFTVLESDRRRK